MLLFSKVLVFLFLLVTSHVIYDVGELKGRGALAVASLSTLLIFFIYYVIGFDMMSMILTLLFFTVQYGLLYRKYIKPNERTEQTISKIRSIMDKEKEAERILQLISELKAENISPIVETIKEVLRIIVEERKKFSVIQNTFMLLVNFARYSFSEQDKESLIKEVSNLLTYAFPERKIFVLKREEVQSAEALKGEFDEMEISEIKLGKIEGRSFTSFPIMENGSAFAYIILKERDINEYEKFFFYLLSRLSESIIKRIDREREIELRAITDPLTNIYNRRYLLQHLEQLFAKFKRLGTIYSLVIFDIDGFKNINDTYGHYVGDMILSEFAKALKSSVRAYDIPARFGGDEFVLLLDGTTKEDAVKVARRVVKKFSDFSSSKEMVKDNVTVSWGLASVQEAATHFEDIIKLADKRLIRAKRTGRGKGVWE